MESDGFKSEDMTRRRAPQNWCMSKVTNSGAQAGEANAIWARLRDSNRCSNLLVVQRFRRRSGTYSRLWIAAAEAQHRGSRRSGSSGPPLVPPLVALAADSGAASLDTLGAGLTRVSQPPDRGRADRRRRPAQALD